MEMGPVSDSFDFLSNAMVFAGQGTGYSDLIRPPLFSFIISLFFRLGFVYTSIVFDVDGILFIFGVIGMYLLLKTRFNEIESFLGALLYATFPIVLTVLSVGFSDLSSVSFSIWAFYFTVLAVKKDSRFFYLAFPFVIFAFLTRFNSALLIFPIFLYILINKNKVNVKNVFIGIIVSILTLVPVLIFFFEKFGNIIYPFINSGTTSNSISFSSESASYDPNIYFFVQKFPDFVGAQGFTIISIVAAGIIVYFLYKVIRSLHDDKSIFEGIKFKSFSYIKLVLQAGLVILFLLTFDKTSYMVNEVLFFVISYLLYDLSRDLNLKDMDLHLMFLEWFMVFFIFNSIFVIKDNRYFVLMAPPVAYFMILGLSGISSKIQFKIKNRNIIFPVLAILLTSIILLSTASEIPLILQSNNDKVIANNQMKIASQWLVSYDPNYKNQNIYSDLWPNFSWYLKTNVKPVPVFKDNQTFPNGVKNATFNQADSDQYNNYLTTNNADYYISVRQGLNLTSYVQIKQFGYVIIYKKKN